MLKDFEICEVQTSSPVDTDFDLQKKSAYIDIYRVAKLVPTTSTTSTTLATATSKILTMMDDRELGTGAKGRMFSEGFIY